MSLSAPSERPAHLLPTLSNFDPQCGFLDEMFELLPRLKILQDNYIQLRDEFRAALPHLEWVNWGADSEDDTGYYGEKQVANHNGYWKNVPLYGQGEEFMSTQVTSERRTDGIVEHPHNCEVLSNFVAHCRKANCVKRVGINVLEPGEQIPPHTDRDPNPPNGYLIRGLWGLDVPEEPGKKCFLALRNPCTNKLEVRHFKNNHFMFFWGYNHHAVYNTLTKPRYVLVVDHEVRTSF